MVGTYRPKPAMWNAARTSEFQWLRARVGVGAVAHSAEEIEWIDRLAIPVLAVRRPAHDLKMQMRGVLRRITGGADEAEGVAARDRATRRHGVVVVIHVRVVVN